MSIVQPYSEMPINFSDLSKELKRLSEGMLKSVSDSINAVISSVQFKSKSLVLLNLSHQLPVAIVANTVQALNTHDYQYFLGIMRKLITTSDFQRVFETLSSLEFAINLARITRRDDLTKLKLEHMQLEFMRIKGVAAKLRHNPESNALREELIRLLSIMEEKLLASSETHEILLSLGTDENQLFDDFRIVTKENGSREMTWKRL